MIHREKIQEEALEVALKYKRVGLAISMGVGKTLIGLKYLASKDHSKKFLVVAPKKTVYESWINDAKKFGYESVLENIEFVSYRSVSKRKVEDYDYVVLDEAHNTLFSHDFWLSHYGGNILALTGTPPKNQQSEHYMMMSKYFPIRYEYQTDSAVNEGILNDYRIHVVKLLLDKNDNIEIKTKDGRTFKTSEWKQYQYYNNLLQVPGKDVERLRILRMRSLMNLKSKVALSKRIHNLLKKNSKDYKILVFCDTQEAADNYMGVSHSYHSNNSNSPENLVKFMSGEIEDLVAVLSLNEGLNVKNLKYTILLHSYSNYIKTSQRIGRALRLNKFDTAEIFVLCYKDTVDEYWVQNALDPFDKDKINWYDSFEELSEKLSNNERSIS